MSKNLYHCFFLAIDYFKINKEFVMCNTFAIFFSSYFGFYWERTYIFTYFFYISMFTCKLNKNYSLLNTFCIPTMNFTEETCETLNYFDD